MGSVRFPRLKIEPSHLYKTKNKSNRLWTLDHLNQTIKVYGTNKSLNYDLTVRLSLSQNRAHSYVDYKALNKILYVVLKRDRF